jgi:hypothetical protein
MLNDAATMENIMAFCKKSSIEILYDPTILLLVVSVVYLPKLKYLRDM